MPLKHIVEPMYPRLDINGVVDDVRALHFPKWQMIRLPKNLLQNGVKHVYLDVWRKRAAAGEAIWAVWLELRDGRGSIADRSFGRAQI